MSVNMPESSAHSQEDATNEGGVGRRGFLSNLGRVAIGTGLSAAGYFSGEAAGRADSIEQAHFLGEMSKKEARNVIGYILDPEKGLYANEPLVLEHFNNFIEQNLPSDIPLQRLASVLLGAQMMYEGLVNDPKFDPKLIREARAKKSRKKVVPRGTPATPLTPRQY